jgi:hypothetical protein
VANRDDHAEAYRVFNMGMVVHTDRDNLEHALAHLESQTPKPIGEIKERGFVIVNGIKLPIFSIILKRKSLGFDLQYFDLISTRRTARDISANRICLL